MRSNLLLGHGAVLLAMAQTTGALAADCDSVATVTDALQKAVESETSKVPASALTGTLGPLKTILIQARAAKKVQAACAAAAPDVKRHIEFTLEDNVVQNYLPFVLAVQDSAYRRALTELEEERLDKQVGAAGPAASTSVTSKGTVPSLLGFAVEHGALTQTTKGTSVTFQGTPLNIFKALQNRDYVASTPYRTPGTLASIAGNISFGVTFDAGKGSDADVFAGESQDLTGASVRYQLLNQRDPRHPGYAPAWQTLRNGFGVPVARALNFVNEAARELQVVQTWSQETKELLLAATPETIDDVILQRAERFRQLADGSRALGGVVTAANEALANYFAHRDETVKHISNSWTLALEYNYTRQFAPADATAPPTDVTTAPATKSFPGPISATFQPPNLSHFRIVGSKGFKDGAEFTGNLGLTLYSSLPAGSTVGRLRDVQVSAQLDVPLPEVRGVGGMVLSFSGLVLHLREEPLGENVTANGKEVTATGTIGLVQAKVTVPVKGAGVKVPLSVTWSNRTELILEKDVRVNFGVTLDLDKLFAKS